MQIKHPIWFACVLVAGTGVGFTLVPLATASPAAQIAPAAPARAGSGCVATEANPRQRTLVPKDTTTGQASEQFGDKLARSDGVLCPPTDVDPDMRAPAPNIGNTPVIPPPGSPGGDPSVRPK